MKQFSLLFLCLILFGACGQPTQINQETEAATGHQIKVGSVGFHVAYKIPNDSTARMQAFLQTHEKFMRETHHLDGDVEPLILTYAVFKAPELNNPLDPNSGETGNTLYGITEIYNGPEGAMAHMKLGQEREAMFAELVSLTNQYCVSGILGAPVIRAMQD